MFLLADNPAPVQGASEQGLEQTLIMVAIALVFFYFILWRPEQKRRKAVEAKRQALKKGDKVVLVGGILGEVIKIQQDTITVALTDGKMEVLKGAIQDIQPSAEPPAAS